MIERLITSLRLLAAPAERQRAHLLPHVPHDDELARDFDDAYRLACDCPQIHLTPAQRDALDEVEARLDAMREAPDAALWTDAALHRAPAWADTRHAARDALTALRVPDAAPRGDAGGGRS